jgi:hypothetical protein
MEETRWEGQNFSEVVTSQEEEDYNASHVFVLPRYILLFYPIDVGSGFLQNMGT